MNSEDPRPKDRQALVNKFRVVKPDTQQATAYDSGGYYIGRTTSVTSGLEPYTGEWGDKQLSHLLRRTLFGIKKTELTNFKALGLSKSIDQLIKESPKPNPPVNDYNGVNAGVVDPVASLGETWTLAPYSNDHEGYRITSLKCWIIKNFINQEATIHEKLILFWHNLLSTQSWDVFQSKASYQHFTMLRKNALGNYRTMIKELTLDPCMLIYLNGTQNKKNAPNENYGRELQELFCVGKGVDSKYTEEDVKAAARVLTGWQVSWDSFNTKGAAISIFQPSNHDTAAKKFSSFYNNTTIAGGNEGEKELDALIEMILATEEASKYICRRIYNFFVYSDIDEATEKNVIVPLAKIFKNSNYQIQPVLKVLFSSAHFFDDANLGAQIKSPIDFMIGMWRAFNISSNSNDLLRNYRVHSSLLWNMASVGLELGDPPNVAGWPAYYQSPQYDKAWITTNTIISRGQVTDSFINYGFWVTSDIRIKADFMSFVKKLNDPSDLLSLIKEASLLLLGYGLSADSTNVLKYILLDGLPAEYYWAQAWNNYVANPSLENTTIVQTRLQKMFQKLLQLGEFQLM